MKRYLGLRVAVLGLVLTAGFAVVVSSNHTHQAPVYSVAELRADLADNPKAWAGRTVRVRGRAFACLASRGAPPLLSCAYWPSYLLDADAGAGDALPFVWGSQDPLPALLRRLPLVSGLVPPLPAPQWWSLATYRVQLRAAANGLCGTIPCYEALLQDAAL